MVKSTSDDRYRDGRYRSTAADVAYEAVLDRIRERLEPDDKRLTFELDDFVGERLGEHHRAGYELARSTLDAVGYDDAEQIATGWQFRVCEVIDEQDIANAAKAARGR